ncbi:MAG: ATP-binding domain-containing protein [Burkholderiaceae bacterium]
MQNLYDREPFEPDGWITLSTPSNYRSPRRLARFLTRLHDMAQAGREPVIAESPFVGERIELFGYADTEGLADASKRAITAALRAGFRRQDIALLSFAGRERSRLLSLDTLGPHALRRFTGQYDLFGSPRYSDGDLVLETVYRFKGQSAPCVIFTEVEFETLDARARRKLFVGASRASMRLFVVASQACVPALESLLDDD